MHRTRAFSVLELIVVLGIIALLVSVLIPAVSGVRQASLAVKDLSNLRNIQLAHCAYMLDHRGQFIDVGLPHGGVHDVPEIAWINTLQEYYDSKLLIHSPLDRSPHWPADQGGEGIPLEGTTDAFRVTSYGCNDYLSRELSPNYAISADPTDICDSLSRVRDTANTVQFLHMAFEGEYAGSDHVHAESWWISAAQPDFPPVQAATQTQTNAVRGPTASWNAESNYGFLDGHAETLHFSKVYLNPDLNRFDPDVSCVFNAQTGGSN